MATRWGICSAGNISSDFTRALRLLDTKNHQVVSVAARSLESAQKFAAQFNISNAYDSYQQLAEDSNVEVVYIGCIHTEHCRLTKLFLNHGKHVVCEKPSAINSRQTNEMLNLAAEKKLFFLEGIWSRFFPAYEQIRKEIKSGAIGTVQYVQVGFGFNKLDEARMTNRALGGGSLLDLGLYPLQFACLAFSGETPERVVASGVLTDEGVDKSTSVTFHYSGNRYAQLTSNMGLELPNKAVIVGDKGMLELPELFWCPNKVVTPDRKYEFPFQCEGFNYPNGAGMQYEAEAVRQCLLKGELESSLVPHSETRLIMKLFDEIRKQIGVVYPADLE